MSREVGCFQVGNGVGGGGAVRRCLTFGLFHQGQPQLDFVDVELTMLKIIQQSGELLMMFT